MLLKDHCWHQGAVRYAQYKGWAARASVSCAYSGCAYTSVQFLLCKYNFVLNRPCIMSIRGFMPYKSSQHIYWHRVMPVQIDVARTGTYLCM